MLQWAQRGQTTRGPPGPHTLPSGAWEGVLPHQTAAAHTSTPDRTCGTDSGQVPQHRELRGPLAQGGSSLSGKTKPGLASTGPHCVTSPEGGPVSRRHARSYPAPSPVPGAVTHHLGLLGTHRGLWIQGPQEDMGKSPSCALEGPGLACACGGKGQGAGGRGGPPQCTAIWVAVGLPPPPGR